MHLPRLADRYALAVSLAAAAALPVVTHMVWQPPVIEAMLRTDVDFFRRWLAPGA